METLDIPGIQASSPLSTSLALAGTVFTMASFKTAGQDKAGSFQVHSPTRSPTHNVIHLIGQNLVT